MNSQSIRCRNGGFTIVELLVAMAVTALLAGILISIVSSMTTAAHRASGALLSSNQAKVALDFLAQDLESAVMRADGNVWLAATIQPDQSDHGDSKLTTADWSTGALKPRNAVSLKLVPANTAEAAEWGIDDYRFGMAGVWLRLFCTEPDSNEGEGNTSTVRAVAYQIARYEVVEGGSMRYGLFRSSVSPDRTFHDGFDLFSAEDDSYNDPSGDQQVPGNVRQPRADYLLANNVIDFGIRFFAREQSGALRLLFPADDFGNPSTTNCGFAATTNAAIPPNPASWEPIAGATMSYGFPEVAEVFLRVLTDEGAKQIEALEAGKISGDWWQIAEANSQVYTRRVEIKGRPL